MPRYNYNFDDLFQDDSEGYQDYRDDYSFDDLFDEDRRYNFDDLFRPFEPEEPDVVPERPPLVEQPEMIPEEPFDREMAPVEPEEPTEYHPLGAAKYTLWQGIKAVGGGLPGAIGRVIPGEDWFEKVGKENKAFYDEIMGDDPDIQEYVKSIQKGSEGFATEVLGNIGPTAAGLGMALIPWAGPVLAIGMFYDLNTSEIEDMAMQKGADRETAEKVGVVGGLINTALDMTGIGRMMRSFKPGKNAVVNKLTNFLLGMSLTAGIEGGTEGTQGIVGEIASDWATKPADETTEEFAERMWAKKDELTKTFLHDASIGAVMGGGFHAVGVGVSPLVRPAEELPGEPALEPIDRDRPTVDEELKALNEEYEANVAKIVNVATSSKDPNIIDKLKHPDVQATFITGGYTQPQVDEAIRRLDIETAIKRDKVRETTPESQRETLDTIYDVEDTLAARAEQLKQEKEDAKELEKAEKEAERKAKEEAAKPPTIAKEKKVAPTMPKKKEVAPGVVEPAEKGEIEVKKAEGAAPESGDYTKQEPQIFKGTNVDSVVAKSTKKPDVWQVTWVDKKGVPLGDSEFTNYEEAVGAARDAAGITTKEEDAATRELEAIEVKPGVVKPLPELKSTEEALEFGKIATPEQQALLKERRESFLDRSKKAIEAGDYEAAMVEATKAQFDREALEAEKVEVVLEAIKKPAVVEEVKEPYMMGRKEYHKQRLSAVLKSVKETSPMTKISALRKKAGDIINMEYDAAIRKAKLEGKIVSKDIAWQNTKAEMQVKIDKGRVAKDYLTGGSHERFIKQALKEGALTPEQYAEMHEADYGKLEDFAPEAVKEPTAPEVEKPAEVEKGVEEVPELPEGWKAEVGRTRVKEGHTAEAEVDWKGKRIVFSEQKHMDNPEIANHEIAHVFIETLPENKRESLLDEYVKTAEVSEWEVKNQFHREKIAIDYGNYLTNPDAVDQKLRTVFDKYTKKPQEGKPTKEGEKVEPDIKAEEEKWIGVGYTKPTAKSMVMLAGAIEYAEGHPGIGLLPWSVKLTEEAGKKLGLDNTFITKATELHEVAKAWQALKVEPTPPRPIEEAKVEPDVGKTDELIKILAGFLRGEVQFETRKKGGKTELILDGKIISEVSGSATQDKAVRAISKEAIAKLESEGRVLEEDVNKMSLDEFTLAYSLGDIIPQFEILGKEIGTVIKDEGEGFTVDIRALYGKIQAQKAKPTEEEPRSAIDLLKDEKGFLSLDALQKSPAYDGVLTTAKDVINQGHTTLEQFTTRMKEVFAETWDKIKAVIGDLYATTKKILKSEVGAIPIEGKGVEAPEVTPPIIDAKEIFKEFALAKGSFRTANDVAAVITNKDSKGSFNDAIKGVAGREKRTGGEIWDDTKTSLKNNLITRIFDRFNPVMQIAGKEAYERYRLTTGAISTFERFLEDGMLSMDETGTPIVTTKNKGWLPWMKSLGPDAEKLLYWVAIKRAEVLEAEGREQWLTKDKRDKIMATIPDKPESGTWGELAKKFKEYNDNVLDYAQDSGLINPEARKQWEQDFYVPFYRLRDESVDAFLLAPMKSRKHISAQIKRLTGKDAKLGDLFENTLRNWSHLIQESSRNVAAKAAFEGAQGVKSLMIDINGEQLPAMEKLSKKDLIKILGAKKVKTWAVKQPDKDRAKRVFDTKEEAQDYRNTLKGDYYIQPRETTQVMMTNAKDNNIISFQEQGKPVHVKINDPELFNAMTNANAIVMSGFLGKMFGVPKRVLTYGATFGPAFRIANMLRDTMHTAIISKSFIPFVDTVIGFGKAFRKDADWISFQSSGAGQGASYTRSDDPAAMSKYIKRAIKKDGTAKRILDTPKKLMEFIRWWDAIGAASEDAARVRLFQKRIAEGNSRFDAAFEARDLLDFTMKGDSQIVQHMVQALPFMNARMQGLYKLGRAAKADPKSFAIKSGILTLGSLALWAVAQDDDDFDEKYGNLQDWEKRVYHNFWIGKYHFRIPRPFELGILPTLLESALDSLKGTDEPVQVFKTIGHSVIDTLAFNPIPQTVRPLAEQWANRTFFTGQPIEGLAVKRLLPSQRKSQYTSVTLSAILNNRLADTLGVSPARAEALINGYLSTVGMFALGLSDILVQNIGDYPEKPTKPVGQYPLIGRFMRDIKDTKRTKFATKFYDLSKEINEIHSTINNYRKLGDIRAARKLSRDNREQLRWRKTFSKDRKSVSDINSSIRKIIANRRMSAERKRSKINRLTKQQNRIIENTIERYMRAKNR